MADRGHSNLTIRNTPPAEFCIDRDKYVFGAKLICSSLNISIAAEKL